MATQCTEYNIRNIFVSKDKNSDFLEFYRTNEVLLKCPIVRIMPSGNFFIYTLDNVHENERSLIKAYQDEWAL